MTDSRNLRTQVGAGALVNRASLNPAAAIIAGLGCLAALVAVFLPQVESSTFTLAGIQHNSLIQNGDGWIVVGFIVGAVLAGWGAAYQPPARFAVVACGLVVIAVAIYNGTANTALTLYRTDFNGNANVFGDKIEAEPGIGLYVAGVGGLLMAAGGFRLTRREAGQAPIQAPPPAAASYAPPADHLTQLQTITELRAAGTLTAEEFEAEKARILGRPGVT